MTTTAATPEDAPAPVPAWQFLARTAWVAVQLLLVLCCGRKGILFFYQEF